MRLLRANSQKLLSGKLGRWIRDSRAVTAVEFSLIALPFITMLVAIIETGYVFFLAIVIEGATSDAARQIRTGAVQESGAPLAQFEAVLCDRVFELVPCGDFIIDVRNYTRFSDATPPAMPGNQAGATFAPGATGDIVVVRVAYAWNFMTPLIDNLMANADGGSRSIIASQAFRNEPY